MKPTTKLNVYAAYRAKQPLRPLTIPSTALGPNHVRVRVSHCGLCHSDVHLIDNDWGLSRYPLTPGHEIIGEVAEKGRAVKHLSIGQRVGIGWQSDSCGRCIYCKRGDENLCAKSKSTCVGRPGGFADQVQVNARFAFPIPHSLPSEEAAPLLCGGITVFAPFVVFGVKPRMNVGVVGLGGLGHLAVQFARKMGCRVTVFSSEPSKKADAFRFGATNFISTHDPVAMRKALESMDFILSTVPADLDWSEYVKMLAPDGKLCFVGVPNKPLTLPIYMLLDGRKSICGSPIGGSALIKKMLSFAARHKIKAQTKTFPFHDVNKGIQVLRTKQARYRVVFSAK